MPCIERRPRCGAAEATVDDTPLRDLLTIVGIIGLIVTIIGAIAKVKVAGGIISFGGVTIGTAAAGGAVAGALTAITIIVVVGLYAMDRCTQGDGTRECVAGVVRHIEPSFSSGWDELLPFTAMHDRVDVVVKSFFWDLVERGEAYVFCTEHEYPQQSEILRCYFFDRQVCDAAKGAQVGAAVGGAAAVIAAALVAAAIGCATIILCLLALLVAVLVAAAVTLAGALAGGQIGKATSEDDSPTAGSGQTLSVGHLVTVNGNFKRRGEDDGANVMWWVATAQFHGMSMSPVPFTYCDIDEELEPDGCARTPIIY